ncbi:hypothetical protein ACIQWQ_01105 [Peribacillus frigoritolerans]
MKKFATLLPKLASRDPTGACFDAAWQTVGGKDKIMLERFLSKKLQANSLFFEFVYSLKGEQSISPFSNIAF